MHPNTAISYSNLGYNLFAQGRYEEAQPNYEKALTIWRATLGERHQTTATSYHNLAKNYYAQGKLADAEKLWAQSARAFEFARYAIASTGLERADYATKRSPRLTLAALQARRGEARSAWEQLEADCGRGLLDDLSTRLLRPLEAEERQREQALIVKLHRLDKQISSLLNQPNATPPQRAQAETLATERDKLQAELGEMQLALSEKYGAAAGKVYELERIQEQLPPNAALLVWIDLPEVRQAAKATGEHWACVVRKHGAPAWVRLPGSGPDAAWTKEDDALLLRVRDMLANRPGNRGEGWTDLLHQLHQQRLVPVEPYLSSGEDSPPVQHLVVLPSPALAGIPIECLSDRYTVTYAPSGTIFAWLREKRHKAAPLGGSRGNRTLLALGAPDTPATPAPAVAAPPDHGVLVRQALPQSNADRGGVRSGDVLLAYADGKLSGPADLVPAIKAHAAEKGALPLQVWRDGQVLDLKVQPGSLGVDFYKQPAAEVILARRESDQLVRTTTSGSFEPLPFSRQEVEAIAQLFKEKKTLLGREANEQSLEALASADRLREFSFLHFATHGLLNDRFALGSALLLSRDQSADRLERVLAGKEVYEGQVTAEQMLRTWKLDADLVTLSACQTALGRPSGGEGYLGFSQALFLAGARSLVLSLWKVDDKATSLLMARFYHNLLQGPEGVDGELRKAGALSEAKRWLRNLTADEAREYVGDLSSVTRGTPGALNLPETPQEAERPYAHPYYWAGFVLVGDPGALTAEENASKASPASLRYYLVTAVVLSVTAVVLLVLLRLRRRKTGTPQKA